MPSERSNQLIHLVRELQRVHLAWAADDRSPHPDDQYRAAAEAVLAGFAGPPIPADCQSLRAAVVLFARRYDEYLQAGKGYPNDAFWIAVANLFHAVDAFQPVVLRPLETLRKLRDDHVPDEQICRIYGLLDQHGRPLPHLIDMELERRGSVLATPGAIDGRTWEDPRVTVGRTTPTGGVSDGDPAQPLPMLPPRTQQATSSPPKPCHETPKDLWRQRVPVPQAARMLQQSETDVLVIFAHFDHEKLLVSAFHRNQTAAVAAAELGIDEAEAAAAFAIFETQQESQQELSLAMEPAAA